MVRGSDGSVHLSRQQSEAGVRVFGTWRTAQVPRDQRAAGHRPHDLPPHGLLRIHDLSAEGLELNEQDIHNCIYVYALG